MLTPGCLVAALLCRWQPFGRTAEYVGRRTLQVYVLHIPFCYLIARLIGSDRLGALLGSPVVAALWPLVATAVLVVVSLWLRLALEKIGLGVLFSMPAGWTRRIDAAYARREARRQGASPVSAGAQLG